MLLVPNVADKLSDDMLASKSKVVLFLIMTHTLVSAQSEVCQIPGDPDILGLGVRLGLYFQFTSNLLIAIVRPTEGLGSLLISSVLASGIFVATIYSLVYQNMPPSAFISTQWFLLLDTAVIPSVLTNVERLDLKERLSFWTLGLMLFRVIAWNCLNTWFWFHGLYVQNPQQCIEPRVFFYTNLGAYGNVRKAFKAFTILFCIYSGWYLIRWIMSLLRRISQDGRTYKERWEVKLDFTWGTYPKHWLPDEAREMLQENLGGFGWTVFVFMCGGFGLCFSILAIELQLRWNNMSGIDGIQTTGQIIPLVIGVVSLFRAIALMFIFCAFGVREEDDE